MKKSMFIAVSAFLMATANVMGQSESKEVAADVDYEMNINMHSLTRYLRLDEEQQDVMEYASEKFTYAVARLKHTREEKRSERLQDALYRNLSYARHALDDNQYHKYLKIMNATLVNKGLKSLLGNDEVAMNK